MLIHRLFFSVYVANERFTWIACRIGYCIVKPLAELLLLFPFMKGRLKKQGRTKKQAKQEAFELAEQYRTNVTNGTTLTEANATMILISYIISSIIIMLPQLLFSYPYVASLLNQYTMLSILFVAALGFLILYLTIWRNDIYLAYFKKFQKDSRVIRWSWHVFSLLFVITLILLWIPLFKYCMSLR